MSTRKKSIEVITGDKVEGDVDPSQAIKGKSSRRADVNEVGGHSAAGEYMFECAWCGAVNHAEDRSEGGLYTCFACGRSMRSSMS